MNAILALCHFCEMHGPKVVFCTQAFHCQDPQHLVGFEGKLEVSGIASALDRTSLSEVGGDKCSGGEGVGGNDAGCEVVQPKCKFYGKSDQWLNKGETSAPTTPVGDGKARSVSLNSSSCTDTCEACRSLPHNGPGFLTNDDETKVSYVSSQFPCDPKLFSIVRQACVRSMSCEVCPGREGPIYFGDEGHEQVFSYTFYLMDSEARGFRRWYSLLIIMMDKIFLLTSWPYLTSSCQHLISRLQVQARSLYQREQAACSQRARRLKTMLSSTIEPRTFRRHRSGGSSYQARPLPTLTGRTHLFKELHVEFTSILRWGGSRLRERGMMWDVDGRSEDAVIDMDVQEETEEGFVNVLTKQLTSSTSSSSVQVEEGGSASHMYPNLDDITREGVEEDVRFTCLRHVLKVLQYSKFHALAYSVLVGKQVVVICNQTNISSSLLQHLSTLIPVGCSKLSVQCTQYTQHSNLLHLVSSRGLDLLPPHLISSSHHLILHITPHTIARGEGLILPPMDEDELAMRYDFNILTTGWKEKIAGAAAPTILTYFEKKMLESRLTNLVLEQMLVAAKEKWLNKAKLVFKYCKAGNYSSTDVERLMHTLAEGEGDLPLLTYWMSGLSSHFHNQVLNAAVNNVTAL